MSFRREREARARQRLACLAAIAGVLGACGGSQAAAPAPPPTPVEARAPADPEPASSAAPTRLLSVDATFADLVSTIRALDDRRDQESERGCLLDRRPGGWDLAADLSVAVRPAPAPPDELGARLRSGAPATILTRHRIHGERGDAAERLALVALTTTRADLPDEATLLVLDEAGVWMRHTAREDPSGPRAPAEVAGDVPGTGAVFVTASAAMPVAALVRLLQTLPDSLEGRIGLAVALEAGTRLPSSPEIEEPAEIEGHCPEGLPPLAEDAPIGQLPASAIIEALGPFRQAATACRGGGRATIAFRIGPDGSVAAACARETSRPSLPACVTSALRATHFPSPRPTGFVDVEMPVVVDLARAERQRALCAP